MELSKEQLLFDLYVAFYDAKRHKSNREYVKRFSENLDANLAQLRDDLWNRRYVPESSSCFIIDYPKKREVYAAMFRDRIVHHLYFNYTHSFYEKTFIEDTYSCIKGRGTSYGIERLRHHILSESENYTKECYVLKLDIKGYFMNINRDILLEIALKTIHKYCQKSEYNLILDFDFIEYLTKEIIQYDCTVNCNLISPPEKYIGLAESKRLSNSPHNCGLPIGNLTSQLFSNVYLNILDQYVKRELKFKHYGRYVDDAYIVSRDKEKLHDAINIIERFIGANLRLELQKGKIRLCNVKYGVEFLGAFLKPFRTYVSNQCLKRLKQTFMKKDCQISNIQSSISKFGYIEKYATHNIREEILIHC